MRWLANLLAGVLAVGASPALACGVIADSLFVDFADVVIDGVATCDLEGGSCVLRARTVVKDSSPLTRITPAYRFHFEPGAAERYRKQQAESNVIVLCGSPPWEPHSERIEGRFYLRRAGGRLLAQPPSGREIPEGNDG